MSDALTATLEAVLTRRDLGPVGRRAHDLKIVGFRNDTNADRFDDAIVAAYREVAGGPIVMEMRRGTVDPGRAALLDPMHPRGVFRMAPGRSKGIWTPGFHKGDRSRPGLVQIAGTKILGWRDNDRDSIFENLLAADDVGGLNLHDGMDEGRPEQRVGHYSHACWVTSKQFVARILELVEAQARAGMGRVVSAHLVDVAQDPDARVFLQAVGIAA